MYSTLSKEASLLKLHCFHRLKKLPILSTPNLEHSFNNKILDWSTLQEIEMCLRCILSVNEKLAITIYSRLIKDIIPEIAI